eukprot:CAMPEP_0181125456 /NCGR_PEP_ID=MMETSP1071-20121207/27061_1 /TAXON_ID=35127 /ORGANISM="Thalassiosira sp., Strain NH16" /LENGTH=680 /DNA_ID=CAMNT_0023210903 /DNA_START=143 /DNA_END=2185 /DNA_ORIENTATION=-
MDELVNLVLNDGVNDGINLSIVHNICGGRRVIASRPLAPGDVIGPSHGTAIESVLDPVQVLSRHPMGRAALGVISSSPTSSSEDDDNAGGTNEMTEKMALWMTLAVMAREAEERQRQKRLQKDQTGTEKDELHDEAPPMKRIRYHDDDESQQEWQQRIFDAYLLSLPRDGPDPCCWSDAERSRLLVGTPLAKQIDVTLGKVRGEYDRIVAGIKSDSASTLSDLPPFCIGGRGIFPSLLWARSMHVSRSFPRSLVDEEGVWWVGHKNYVPPSSLSSCPSSALGGKGNRVGNSDNAPNPGKDTKTTQESNSQCEDDSPAILSIRLGGWRAPMITRQQAIIEPKSQASPNTKPGSTLGILIPLYDMMDHKPGYPVQWEAAAMAIKSTHKNKNNNNIQRRIRFRSVHSIAEGEPIWNNYGPKGNLELLSTYGFTTKDNVMDSVEGIVLGLRTPMTATTQQPLPIHSGKNGNGNCTKDTPTVASNHGAQEAQVHEARMALIKEHSIPHRFENDGRLLLLGPFALHRKLQPPRSTEEEMVSNKTATASDASTRDNSNSTPECSGGVITDDLYRALSLIGMESVEEGPVVSEDELELLQDVLMKKLEGFVNTPPKESLSSCFVTGGEFANNMKDSALGGSVSVEATTPVKNTPKNSRAESVDAYKSGQKVLLRLALAELDSLMPQGD